MYVSHSSKIPGQPRDEVQREEEEGPGNISVSNKPPKGQ